jgi:hypothetical protein
MKVLICALGVVALSALPARASTVSFTSPLNTFYVGTEDSSSTTCDCDYNDLLFSVASTSTSGIALVALYGTGDLQTAEPSLFTSSSVTTLNSGTPFWNTVSGDSTYANFGECLYDSSPHNTCTANGTAHTPIDTTAQYLAGPGTTKAGPNKGDANGSVDFYFTETKATNVTFTLLQSIAGTPANDEAALYACKQGAAVNNNTNRTANCINVSITSGTATLTAAQVTTLGDSFDLLFYRGGGGGFGPYDSNTTVTGDSDASINHFAVAVAEPLSTTPEPASVLLVGGGLLVAGFLRRRQSSRQSA